MSIALGSISSVVNQMWLRFLRSTYRKDRVSSFILIVGIVDAVIGGVGDRGSLMTLGMGVIGVAVGLRLWAIQHRREEVPVQAPVYYLPDRSSRPALPNLTVPRSTKG